MRALIAFLLIAAAAVTLALLFRLNTGYVLFVAPPYRVELSQNAFIIIARAGFLALYALIRAGVRLAKLPEEVREGPAPAPIRARFAASRMPLSSRCWKDDMARRDNSRRRRLRFRTRRRSQRSSARAQRSRHATTPPLRRC